MPSKKNNPNRKPEHTEPGVTLIATDRAGVFARVRHIDADAAHAEARRLAKNLNERVLVMLVVAAYDGRNIAAEQLPNAEILIMDAPPAPRPARKLGDKPRAVQKELPHVE